MAVTMSNHDLWAEGQTSAAYDRMLEDLDAARQSRWEDFFCWVAWILAGAFILTVWAAFVWVLWLAGKVVTA